jgi:Beta-ketoacyl synthase, N-terminal domain
VPIATQASQAFVSSLKTADISEVTVDTRMNSPVASRNNDNKGNGNFKNSKLAITGYSGRFPDANSNEEFWDLLREGRDVVSETPLTRWDIETNVDPTGKTKNTSGTPYGCWLNDPGLFDARFFGMSPREAPQVDPAQRLALHTAYEAMENAGMVPDTTPSTQRDRIGVFYGTTSNDWGERTVLKTSILTIFLARAAPSFQGDRIISSASVAQATVLIPHVRRVWQQCTLPVMHCGVVILIQSSVVEPMS